MLENPATDSSSAATTTTVKRYAPPNQRNRPLGRRKSGGGDRLERTSSYSNDGDKNPISATRSNSLVDHGDAAGSNPVNKNARRGSISLHGCCNSEAFQLLNDRWSAAMTAYNNLPQDSPERPVLYTRRNVSPWGLAMLPHQLMQPTSSLGDSTGLQKDFASELWHAMRAAHASSDA